MSNEKSDRIRELNDAFRKTGLGGRMVFTHGVLDLGIDKIYAIRGILTNYDEFTTDNDPYGEHDFGSFELEGDKFFWKIDYYNTDMTAGSEDAADPDVTTRVLTVMLRHEN